MDGDTLHADSTLLVIVYVFINYLGLHLEAEMNQ